MAEKIRIENELFVGQRAMSADAPSLNALRTRLDAINDQIDRLKTKLTSSNKNDTPLSQAIVQFEELELKRIFAEKVYSMSQDALERARAKAERQNVYIDVFVPPTLPEEARYPERISLSLIIPIALLIVWGIISLLVSTVEDHRN
jgi:capsular polysaccharide transport system permease protein